MRWNSRIRFAFFPVQCNSCYNIMWLERYTVSRRVMLDIGGSTYSHFECQECKPINSCKNEGGVDEID